MDETSGPHLLSGAVEVMPVGSINKELILYINAIEVDAESESARLKNVLKKIMPLASGIYLNDLNGTQTFAFEWNVSKDFAAGNLGVVAYLQEKDSKKVLQSSFITMSSGKEAGPLTALNKLSQELKKMEVYPNPVDTDIRLKTSQVVGQELTYEIIELNGTILQKGRLKAGEKEYSIHSHSLKNGMYILRVYSEKSQVVTFKIMVQHKG